MHLSRGHADVWLTQLERSDDELRAMRAILSDEEIARAQKFFLDRDRNRFIAARATLRKLLAAHVECPAKSIRFEYNRWGKPALARGFASTNIRFNLSHSQGLAVFAIARDCEVGVDVEKVRPEFATTQIAERFFSRDEVQTLRSIHPSLQCEAFFNCWTRKEAYVKARGEGLSIDLASFDVSIIPGEPVRIVRASDRARWSLASYRPAPEFVAAVAFEGNAAEISSPRFL